MRELLTTFRLKMEGQDLPSALRQTVDEFIERGNLSIELDIDLEGCSLTPNEEIHVLHIVSRITSYNVCYTKLLRCACVWSEVHE